MNIGLSDFLAGVAVLISLGSVAFTIKQQQSAFRLAWVQQVVSWAKECIRVMSSVGEFLTDSSLNDYDRAQIRYDALSKLTSLIDEGRFVFENNRKTSFGKEKPSAYQGYRPRVLDFLVESYNILNGIDHSIVNEADVKYKRIVELKRRFVSDIQLVISPNWFWKEAKIDESAKRIEKKA